MAQTFQKPKRLYFFDAARGGGDVERNNPELLEKMLTLTNTIDTYDADSVYNMDKTGLCFPLLLS
jgi:hypothetical protein